MTDKRAEFDTAVTAARRERRRAEAELAISLTHQLRDDPLGFDPRCLGQLGPLALKSMFTELVGSRESAPIRPAAGAAVEMAKNAEGWAHLRHPEMHYRVAGILLALFLSVFLTAAGALARAFLS
jgi:hypothetical protein